ncbi:DNA-directed RNA polymerase I subunit RPA12 isoform X2 [Chiroxiphia lanceolata]|uniref:DNA-directed RNA polymerase I subunit RPA12 isoform X2 n=1 Tax=Chiroxiphia lanceolata TaxID=296741 RepID=UPI0013CED871|nr:DNA-directed RNA polymerase I subunit RPA12 isoform X2 [Chiroxiphia lanceolata]
MELPPSCFQSCLDFCPECGSVLPPPGPPPTIRCPRCSFTFHCAGGAEMPPLWARGDVLPHPADALGRRGPERLLHLPPLQVAGEGGFLKEFLKEFLEKKRGFGGQ